MPFTKNSSVGHYPTGLSPNHFGENGLQPTGISTLDKTLCGGLPVGSLTCIEDYHSTGPATIVSKCLISHACLLRQKIVVDQYTSEFTLPLCKLHEEPLNRLLENQEKQEFKIAWRYSTHKELTESGQRYSCDFENTNTLDSYPEDLKLVVNLSEENSLDDIQCFIQKTNPESASNRKPAKICFHVSSFADCTGNINFKSIFKIKSILRNLNCCAIIIVPDYLPMYSKHSLLNLCDFYIKFNEFQITLESQNEPMFKEYAGNVNFLKVWNHSSFKVSFPIVDLVYKFKRKNLVIEKGCLLPDLSETASRSEKRPELSKTNDLF